MGSSGFWSGEGAVLGKTAATSADLSTPAFANVAVGVGAYVASRGRIYWSVPIGRGDIAGTGNDWKSDPSTSDPSFLVQAAWFIDTAGSDDNTGLDIAHPIKTIGEMGSRWGVSPVIAGTLITIANGNYGANQQTIQFATKTATDIVKIAGTPSTITADTVGTFTAPSTVTNRMYLLTGTLIADWTPYVGKRIRFTASGATCMVLKVNPFALGNATAEITAPQNEPVAPNYSALSFVPAAGNAFVVENLPLISRLSVVLDSPPSQVTDGTFKQSPTVVVTSINTPFSRWITSSDEAPAIRVWGCILQTIGVNLTSPNSVIFNTCLINANNFFMPTSNYNGCGFMSQQPTTITSLTFNFWAALSACTFEGVGLTVGFGGFFAFNCGFFNSPVDGISTNAQAAPTVISGFCLGSGNARGLTIGNGTVVNKIGGFANMKLTGAAGDWRFGSGAIFAWADAPRAQNYGSGANQLGAGGTVNVAITNLPADAAVTVTARVVAGVGATGVLRVPAQTTAQFTCNSAVATETTTFGFHWFSPSSPAGGLFST